MLSSCKLQPLVVSVSKLHSTNRCDANFQGTKQEQQKIGACTPPINFFWGTPDRPTGSIGPSQCPEGSGRRSCGPCGCWLASSKMDVWNTVHGMDGDSHLH